MPILVDWRLQEPSDEGSGDKVGDKGCRTISFRDAADEPGLS